MRLQLSTIFFELCILASQYDPGRTHPIVSNACVTLSLVDVRAEELTGPVLRDGGVAVTLDEASVLGSRWCDGVVSGEEHDGVTMKMKSFNKVCIICENKHIPTGIIRGYMHIYLCMYVCVCIYNVLLLCIYTVLTFVHMYCI